MSEIQISEPKPLPEGLYENPNAMAWADYYCQINPDADHGTMLGWFANAMMATHDHLLKGAVTKKEAGGDTETVAVTAYPYEIIAEVCHEANRIWCQSHGDYSQKTWSEAEQWQRDSAISGARFRLDNPNAGKDAQHNAWMKEKVDAGWVYGEVKDAEKKTHPCIVPFEKLPEFQQKKDALFCAIVDALK